jgi:GTP-binding protein EngB required for normal cell division
MYLKLGPHHFYKQLFDGSFLHVNTDTLMISLLLSDPFKANRLMTKAVKINKVEFRDAFYEVQSQLIHWAQN